MVDGVNNFNLASYSKNVDKTNNVPPIVLYNRQPTYLMAASQEDRFERQPQQEKAYVIDPNDRFVNRVHKQKDDEQMLGARNLKALIKPSQIDDGLKIIKNLYDGYDTVEKFKNI